MSFYTFTIYRLATVIISVCSHSTHLYHLSSINRYNISLLSLYFTHLYHLSSINRYNISLLSFYTFVPSLVYQPLKYQFIVILHLCTIYRLSTVIISVVVILHICTIYRLSTVIISVCCHSTHLYHLSSINRYNISLLSFYTFVPSIVYQPLLISVCCHSTTFVPSIVYQPL